MSTQVTVTLDLTPEALQKAFPTAQSVKLNRSNKSVTLEFASVQDVKAFEKETTVQLDISQRPQIVYTKPNVTAAAPDATKLVTITDTKTTTGGRVYKNSDLPSRHISSLKFAPVINSVILPQVDFNIVQIQVISVNVIAEKDGRFAVYMRVYHKLSGRYGVLVLKRYVNETGEVKYSRRCFDLLVDKDDYKKTDEDVVPVHFISIESITVDPATGLWSELKIALDEVSPKLGLFRFGTKRRSMPKRGGFPRRGGFRGGFARRGGFSRRGGAPGKRRPMQQRSPRQPQQQAPPAPKA